MDLIPAEVKASFNCQTLARCGVRCKIRCNGIVGNDIIFETTLGENFTKAPSRNYIFLTTILFRLYRFP